METRNLCSSNCQRLDFSVPAGSVHQLPLSCTSRRRSLLKPATLTDPWSYHVILHRLSVGMLLAVAHLLACYLQWHVGILLCSGTTAVDASPRFAFADVLSDGMVLQAAPSFSVLWGRAPSFLGRMTVRIDGVEVLLDEAVQEQAWLRDNGSHFVTWHLELPPQPAGGPHELQVDAEFWDESITLAGVLFGDVFICGGQSNMQMGMSQAHRHDMADVTTAAADGALQNIRMLTVDFTAGAQNLFPDSAQARMFYTDYTTEYHTLPLLHGWEPVLPFSYFGPPAANSTREQTYLPQGFSIVCLMFGIETFQRAGGIRPVGLISASCGGSAIEYHMPHSGLVQCLHLAPPHSERLGYLPYDILENGTPHPLGRIPPGSDGMWRLCQHLISAIRTARQVLSTLEPRRRWRGVWLLLHRCWLLCKLNPILHTLIPGCCCTGAGSTL